MKQVFILRGLPGCGKSHYAKSLCEELVDNDQNRFALCSTDDFFYSEKGYRFDKSRLSEYHNLNLVRFIRALSNNTPLVILDNTNIKKWEFAAHIEAAHAFGYQVKEVVVGEIKDKAMQHLYFQRNTHKVPLKTINKMAFQFEW
jgi:tRNA uridine 5-carbamoylmethylation protein Kti12